MNSESFNQLFPNSHLHRQIHNKKNLSKIQRLAKDWLQISCLAVSHSNHYTRMFCMPVWCCNRILFIHGWFCPNHLIHLTGQNSFHLNSFLKEDHFGNDARIVLKQNKFSKKVTSNRAWTLASMTVVFPVLSLSNYANFQVLIEGSLTPLLFVQQTRWNRLNIQTSAGVNPLCKFMVIKMHVDAWFN